MEVDESILTKDLEVDKCSCRTSHTVGCCTCVNSCVLLDDDDDDDDDYGDDDDDDDDDDKNGSASEVGALQVQLCLPVYI